MKDMIIRKEFTKTGNISSCLTLLGALVSTHGRRVEENKTICDAFIRVCNSCGHASPRKAGYAHAQETPVHRLQLKR